MMHSFLCGHPGYLHPHRPFFYFFYHPLSSIFHILNCQAFMPPIHTLYSHWLNGHGPGCLVSFTMAHFIFWCIFFALILSSSWLLRSLFHICTSSIPSIVLLVMEHSKQLYPPPVCIPVENREQRESLGQQKWHQKCSHLLAEQEKKLVFDWSSFFFFFFWAN
jgi:hypothetical protein